MSSFKSQPMTAVSQKFVIDMRYSAIYHSQSHAAIERAQRTLEIAQKILKRPVAKYMQELSIKIQTMLNATHENMTKAGRRMKLDFDKKSTDRRLNLKT